MAFTAEAELQCESTDAQPNVSEKNAANYTGHLAGHMLVHAPRDAAELQLTAEIDAVQLVAVALAASQELVKVLRPPEFVMNRWFEKYVDAITAPGRAGMIIIAGSNQAARRRVAEHLLHLKQRRDPDVGGLYLIGYPAEFNNTLIHVPSSETVGEDDLFERAHITSAKGIAVSLEQRDWLAPALGFVIQDRGVVIATMRRATGVSAVVRELHSNRDGRDIALENLLGVVVVMAADDRQIRFRAATGGDWGDGSWWGILEHDEFVSGYRT